jgi:hypothetical protein
VNALRPTRSGGDGGIGVFSERAVTSDLRSFVAEEIRLHPRVAYQGLLQDEGAAGRLAAALSPLPRFRHD